MTSQQEATILLLDHQASREARMRLAGLREHQLAEYYQRKPFEVQQAEVAEIMESSR